MKAPQNSTSKFQPLVRAHLKVRVQINLASNTVKPILYKLNPQPHKVN